jgi:hypothetical protein
LSVVLLLLAISVSFIAVRIGALALELTGMPWDHAKFQALSAFTNAGFTTRESEEVTRHPLRRRIASIMIVLGNAGLITTIGSLASSLSQPQPLRVLGNVFVIVTGIASLGWLAHRPAVTRLLHARVSRWMARRYPLQAWAPDELLHLDRGYVLTKFELTPSSPAADHTLRELRLKQNRVQVLAVERGHDFHGVPDGEFRLAVGDEVVVYGVKDTVERVLQPGEDQTFLVVDDEPSTSVSEAEEDGAAEQG